MLPLQSGGGGLYDCAFVFPLKQSLANLPVCLQGNPSKFMLCAVVA